jgi:hypothetical protein
MNKTAPDEAKAVLLASVGRRVSIDFIDGVTQAVDIASVDDEGFMHSGPDGIDPNYYWTRFESVVAIRP